MGSLYSFLRCLFVDTIKIFGNHAYLLCVTIYHVVAMDIEYVDIVTVKFGVNLD